MEIVWLLVIVVIAIGYTIQLLTPSLSSKFEGVGDVRGKTLYHIISHVGAPNAVSYPAPQKLLAQWIQGCLSGPIRRRDFRVTRHATRIQLWSACEVVSDPEGEGLRLIASS